MIVLQGPDAGRKFPLNHDETLIGRSLSAHLRVEPGGYIYSGADLIRKKQPWTATTFAWAACALSPQADDCPRCGYRPDPQHSNWVLPYPSDATEASVTALFSEFGKVRSIELVTDIFSGRCKGFAFIGMEGRATKPERPSQNSAVSCTAANRSGSILKTLRAKKADAANRHRITSCIFFRFLRTHCAG